LHPYFFQNARGSFIFDIAHSPDAVNEFEIPRPVNYSLGRLGYVSTVPLVAAEDVSNIGRMITNTASDHSDNAIFL
jgi:hypothetical protein